MNFIYERINEMLSRLHPYTVRAAYDVDGVEYAVCGYKTSDKPDDELVFAPFGKNDRFGGYEEWHGWFRFKLHVPECPDGCTLELENYYGDGRNPQFLVYLDGKLIHGTDANHRSVELDPEVREYDVLMYAYTGYDCDEYKFMPRIIVRDTEVTALYYDIRVPFETLGYMDRNTREYVTVRDALNGALNLLDWRAPGSDDFRRSAAAAREYMKNEFYGRVCRDGNSEGVNIVSIGHTHIDVAWLWTFAQTREKVERTFSTMIAMMKKYPEFKFMSSQAQLYKFVKEDAPDLYREICGMVKAGRWEVEGAMWVEADCNLTGGEALIRQIIYGKKFFRDEFGVESHVLWLPDVFGYSAAMPQILKKCNVDKFVTSKISWNETNRLPHDVFEWQGIDGERIFSYFLTAQRKPASGMTTGTTYNADTDPGFIYGTWNRMQDKELTNEVLNTYGYGDGGGGPTVKMVEYALRQKKSIGGAPTVTLEFAGDFLDRCEKAARATGKLPVWSGELYLEYHRGTYTSNAKNKKNNRRSEYLYMDAEASSVLDTLLFGGKYPRDDIMYGWEKIMLCQFHDVLPGSSIKPVYDDTDIIYADIIGKGRAIVDADRGRIAAALHTGDDEVIAFNRNGFTASGVAELDGERVYVSGVPSKGYGKSKLVRGHDGASVNLEKRTLENGFIRVEFDENYNISSVFDKSAHREALSGLGNRLVAYEDFPRAYDAWEITNYYREKSYPVDDVSSVETVDLGAEVGLRITRHYGKSTIVQTLTVSPYDKKITVYNRIDWHERHTLLKSHTEAAVNSDRAVYEIQYGHVTRPTHENTSWDAAKFEVCAHKYADISDHGYGIAVINDCKYGYSCSGTNLSITLLKSATHPNPEADQGMHEFTYAILPHEGDFRDAGVIEAAYMLNQPIELMRAVGDGDRIPTSVSLASSDKKNVIIEAVKQAEDGDGVIVRIYDAYNQTTEAKLTFGFNVADAYICDMEENELERLECEDNSVDVCVGAFEIVTLKLKTK